MFILLLAGPWVAWGCVRVFNAELFNEYSDVSGENRSKNQLEFGELLRSGESFSAFIDDRIPFRKLWIDGYQKYYGKLEKAYSNSFREVSNFLSGNKKTQTDVASLDDSFFNEDASAADISDNESNGPSEETDHIHQFEIVDSLDPDCENPGYKEYECSICLERYKEFLARKGHNKVFVKHSDVSYTTYGFDEYVCADCGKNIRENFEAKYIDTSFLAPQILNNSMMLGRFDWMFLTQDHSLDYYQGTNLLSKEQLDAYGERMNILKAWCDAYGKEIYIMFMPNKEQVYDEYMPTVEIADTYKRTKRIVDYMNAHTGVSFIYPLEELETAETYWPVYYQYDTHWNHIGAFMGMQALYKEMGMETTNPLNLEMEEKVTTRSDLMVMGGLSPENYVMDTDYLPVYKPDVYCSYCEEEGYEPDITRTVANVPGGKNLVFIGDSFRTLLAPYITKDFLNTTLVHRKALGECYEDIINADVIVISAVERYDTEVFDSAETIMEFFRTYNEQN